MDSTLVKTLPRLAEARLDLRVLGFTLLVSLLTGILFGLAPALQSWRIDLNEVLKEGGRGSSDGARHNRIRSALIVAEVAIAIVLLVGAGLLIQSLRRLQHVSTAYVAGNRPDLAMESEIDVGQTFKNPYEESKCRSELIVAEAHHESRSITRAAQTERERLFAEARRVETLLRSALGIVEEARHEDDGDASGPGWPNRENTREFDAVSTESAAEPEEQAGTPTENEGDVPWSSGRDFVWG